MNPHADPDRSENAEDRQRPVVILSVEDDIGLHCVDILEISGQGFGFREFRRDPEDPHGWRPTGLAINCTLSTYDQAVVKAGRAIQWLNELQRSAL